MKDLIVKELFNVEEILNVKILYAVESGSRAWGFKSTDSDWDVRFIYIHKKKWYLSIDEKKDSYEKILPNEIDLAGWEFKKAMKLFRKSNPPLMEWLRSPIIYMEKYTAIKKLRELANEYFNPKSCLYHYLNMAEGNYRTYLKTDEVRIKKYFYLLRPLLACSWIEERNTMAPMEFDKLVESQVNDENVKAEIYSLLKRKKEGEELGIEPKINLLNRFIDEKIQYFNNYLKKFNVDVMINTEKLNIIFRETLDEVDR